MKILWTFFLAWAICLVEGRSLESTKAHIEEKLVALLERKLGYKMHGRYLHINDREAQVTGGTVIVKKNPLNFDQENTNQNNNADPKRGLSDKEYKTALKNVMATKVIDEIKTGHKVGNIAKSNLIGDIAYGAETSKERFQSSASGNRKRKLSSYAGHKWPKNINYVVDWAALDKLNSKYRPNIAESFKIIEDNTCLTFTEGKPADGSKYLRLNADESGCWSYLGKESGTGPQPVNLGQGCYYVGTIIHEIGHALGMVHEQNRPGRDNYLDIKWDNIKDGRESQFSKAEGTLTHSSDYDYASVMQYAVLSFSKSSTLKTLVPKDTDFEKVMGQDVDLSFFDIVAINRHYECGECPSLKCQNDGIPNPKSNCKKCICPEGFGGDLCDSAGTRSSGCTPQEGVLTATGEEQCVSSPNFPNYYTNNDKCNWIIKSNSDMKIQYYFKDEFFVPFEAYDSHCFHWVEIKDSTNTTQRGKRYCGPISPGFSKTSVSDTIVVYFSGQQGGESVKGKGFKLCFKENDGKARDTSCVNADDYKCPKQSQCVPKARRCDSNYDCADRSDEKDCPPATCSADEFLCRADNKCIYSSWKCDKEPDCSDGEDEGSSAGCGDSGGSGSSGSGGSGGSGSSGSGSGGSGGSGSGGTGGSGSGGSGGSGSGGSGGSGFGGSGGSGFGGSGGSGSGGYGGSGSGDSGGSGIGGSGGSGSGGSGGSGSGGSGGSGSGDSGGSGSGDSGSSGTGGSGSGGLGGSGSGDSGSSGTGGSGSGGLGGSGSGGPGGSGLGGYGGSGTDGYGGFGSGVYGSSGTAETGTKKKKGLSWMEFTLQRLLQEED